MTNISIALSGGGHRATLFTLGALMYVVDAGRAAEVGSIASVSGGSITNGVVAQAVDFQATNSKEFEEKVVKPLVERIATKGTLFGWWFTWAYLALLVVWLVGLVVGVMRLEAAWCVEGLGVLGALAAWGWLVGRRGWVCGRAFRKTLFAPGGKATLLRDTHRNVAHVVCATELRSSQSMYFGGDFVYTNELGPGVPADMPLYQAVQASAAFPGGFPPARFPALRHKFEGKLGDTGPERDVKTLVLSDGGVYDNMGEQWARGFRERARRWRWLRESKAPPEQMVVVNASARVPWVPLRWQWVPFLGEVLAFLRVNNVLYVNTTNVRRQEIVKSYDPVAGKGLGDLPGCLVQIAQSPFDVADAFAKVPGDGVGARARAVLELLGEGTRGEWEEIAKQDSAVATTLRTLGPEVAARLVRHGYVTAMCNLHVVFGDWQLLSRVHKAA